MKKFLIRGGVILLIALCLGCQDWADEIASLKNQIELLKQKDEGFDVAIKAIQEDIKELKENRYVRREEDVQSQINTIESRITDLENKYVDLIDTDEDLQRQIEELKRGLKLESGVENGWYTSGSNTYYSVYTEDLVPIHSLIWERGSGTWNSLESQTTFWELENDQILNKGNRMELRELEDYWGVAEYLINIIPYEFYHKDYFRFREWDNADWVYFLTNTTVSNQPKLDESFKSSVKNTYSNITDDYFDAVSVVENTLIEFFVDKRGMFDVFLTFRYRQKVKFSDGYMEWKTNNSGTGKYGTWINIEDKEEILIVDKSYKIEKIDKLPYQTNQNFSSDLGIFGDEVYGSIVRADEHSYLRAFIADAKRHGVDLSHIDVDNYVFELLPKEASAAGTAGGNCDDSIVNIAIGEQYWAEDILIQDAFKIRQSLKIMWHEFGHDLLNLWHTCESYHIMSARESYCDPDKQTFRAWYNYNDPNPIYNWQRAVKDMFEGTEQVFSNCSGNRGSTKITCDHEH